VSPMYKVYKVHTQVGFLNIHSEPGDPFRMDNVVGRWSEGDVIKVKGEPLQTRFGPWLQTCKGWSIQIYDDFHWLRPLSPDDAPQEAIAHEHATSEKDKSNDHSVVTGDLASTHNVGNKFDYEGTLSLQFDIPESGDDFQVKLRAVLSKQWYKEASSLLFRHTLASRRSGFLKVPFDGCAAVSPRQVCISVHKDVGVRWRMAWVSRQRFKACLMLQGLA